MKPAMKKRLKEAISLYHDCLTEQEILKIEELNDLTNSQLMKFLKIFNAVQDSTQRKFGIKSYDMFYKFYFEKASLGKIAYEHDGIDESEVSKKITNCAKFFLAVIEPRYIEFKETIQLSWDVIS